MDAPVPIHPRVETLQAYGLGKLDEQAADTVSSHLEVCSDCRRQITEMTPARLLDRMHAVQATPEASDPYRASSGFLPPETTESDIAIGNKLSNPCMSATGGCDPASDAPTSLHADDTGPGILFGDYELESVLGEGGMGVVYKARQLSLNRSVALKMIRAARFASPDEVRRFQNESEAAARLDHSNIVPVFEVGQHKGQHYFSMKLIAGESLDKRPFGFLSDPRRAAELVATTAGAIHHAHQRGILHRDLKPANILIDFDGQPHVTDFGLAKWVNDDHELTRSGAIVGTPAFMAPEQASGKRGGVTTASDVYGLGTILYFLLTGSAPFGGNSVIETLEQVRRQPPDPPITRNPRVPSDLEVICLKCLEKEPRRRYASAHALAEELVRWLSGEPITARRVGMPGRLWMLVRRRPVISGLAAALLVAVLGGFIGTSLSLFAARKAQAEEERQTELANTRLRDAVAARRDAERESARAKAQTELAERRLYDVRMNLVQRYWEDYQGEQLRQGLIEEMPLTTGGTDRRGFEWFYWHRTMASGHITLGGGAGGARSVAFSPNGEWLASGNDDGTVKTWNARTGEKALTLKGHGDWVWCVAFSPDGNLLASASRDQTVKVWEAHTGRVIRTLSRNSGNSRNEELGVTSVMFSPDHTRLACAYDDGTVNVCDAVSGKVTLTVKGDAASIMSCVAFSPDGKRFASVCDYGTLKVWDAVNGQAMLNLKGHAGRVTSVAFSPDGQQIVSGSWDQTVRVWNAVTGQIVRTIEAHSQLVNGVAISRDGHWLAAASGGTVRIWDCETGSEIRNLKGHTGLVMSVAFSPESNRLVSASLDETVRLWDTVKGQEPLTLDARTGIVNSVAFSPDGKWLASASNGIARLWDAETGREIRLLGDQNSPLASVAFSPDGGRIASASTHGTLKVVSVSTGLEILTLKGHSDEVTRVTYSPDGTRLASASLDQTVKVWNAANGQELRTLKGHTDLINTVAYSPNGKRLASASHDDTVRVWDAETGKAILSLKGYASGVDSVAFSPDCRRLSTASGDRAVTVWDAESGEEILSLKGHLSDVVSVAFNPDGTRVACATDDGTVTVWDAETGQETLALRGHAGRVTSVAFSPDGKRLASGSWDGTVRVWDARPLINAPALYATANTRSLDEAHRADPMRTDVVRSDQEDSPSAVGELARSRPEDYTTVHRYILTLLEIGDRHDASLECHELLSRFNKTTDPELANSVAWSCVLAPGSVTDIESPVRLAEMAVKDTVDPGQRHVTLNTLGAALYRAGRFELAASRLNEAIDARGGLEDPLDWPFLAMAHHRLGHRDEARRWLDRFHTRQPTADNRDFWSEAEIRLLRIEAEAVVLYDPVFPADPFARWAPERPAIMPQ
jgi:eukaryotic-like serine/threonine-protein kinase